MNKLEIKNLHVKADDKEILKGINISFETGKTYALIGPNGNGKSTLLSTIMGDPSFTITSGEILFNDKSINNLEVSERSKLGIFLGMQYPPEIDGVGNLELIKASLEKKHDKQISLLDVYADAVSTGNEIRIDKETLERDVNVGFSGGEKKKNELLHMFMLSPSFALLDEVDSGLDVDSILAISESLLKNKADDKALILVSHYKKMFETVKPDMAIVIKDGVVSETGDYDFLMKTLERGFDVS